MPRTLLVPGALALALLAVACARRPVTWVDAGPDPVADAREFVLMRVERVPTAGPKDDVPQWLVHVKVVGHDRDGPLPHPEVAESKGIGEGVWEADSSNVAALFGDGPTAGRRTLQSPKMLVLDGQRGTVFIGETKTPAELEDAGVRDVGVRMHGSSEDMLAESVHAGTELVVTPTASEEGAVTTRVRYRRWHAGDLVREVPATSLRMTTGKTYVFEAPRRVQ